MYNLEKEKESWALGHFVCGVDEVGRGCLAGPVVSAAVVFSSDHLPNHKINDSKKISPKKREELFFEILDKSHDFGIGLVSAFDVDRLGIVAATKQSMREAVSSLKSPPNKILIDAVYLEDISVPQESIIKGDAKIYSIAAASIVAKVFRDRVVTGLDGAFPDYGFSAHKGYGTKTHLEALRNYGLTDEHRKTFLKNITVKNG